VAYAVKGWEQPKLIQEWPGKEGEFQSKVPTLLTYKGRKLSSWGFLCEEPGEREDEEKYERRWFKLHLDEDTFNKAKKFANLKEVETLYKDFLTELYKHIKLTMETQQRKAWRGKVQFMFSVPTTWNQATLTRYQKIIKDAGFGSERNHKVQVTWTEAQAAAIYTAKNLEQDFSKGDVLLVCDAGGGTTDLAILEQTEHVERGQVPQLKELYKTFGVPAGSTRIDNAFLEHATERLKKLKRKHKEETENIDDVEAVAEEMMRGQFQGYKCSFGKPISQVPKYNIKIKGLSSSFSDPECDVVDGKLVLTK
jgi:hypothetical protein